MNVLILGSGGREHALGWKLTQSPLLKKLFFAPGNAGTLKLGTNVSLDPTNFSSIGEFVIAEQIIMVVVGPEQPLVLGIRDYFSTHQNLHKVTIIGPDKNGAILEGSKKFSKNFMQKYKIPTASFKSFTRETLAEAKLYINKLNPPYVIKADGLAAGKGVLILDDPTQAIKELNEMFSGKFGEAGKVVVIEEFLKGIELSVFILTDGQSYLLLPEAKDYKRIGEGDTGLNTGGMGAISPIPFADKTFMKKVTNQIIEPTLKGLAQEGITYKGFIFFGLMNVKGNPYLIEYNVRMGDPESEVVIPRIKSDLLRLLVSLNAEGLGGKKLEIKKETVSTVMMVSGGYPEAYEKGKVIKGIEEIKESIVFHAGTKKEEEEVISNGGRVLAVSSYGKNIREALENSYLNIEKIKFEGSYYRTDIGFDLF